MAPPTLFTLPLELRQKVYSDLLLSPENAPSRPQAVKSPSWYHSGLRLPALPEKGDLLYAGSGLLLTSKQVRSETLDVVSLLREQIPWRLDIPVGFSEGRGGLTPKWMALPAPPSAYKASDGEDEGEGQRHGKAELNVIASFRIKESVQEHTRWGGCGGPGPVASNLLSTLGHWCENGVLFTAPHASFPHPSHRTYSEENKVRTNDLMVLFVPWDAEAPVTRADVQERGGDEDMHSFDLADKHPQVLHYGSLVGELWHVMESGLLEGYVKRVLVGVEGREPEHVWEVKAVDEKFKWEISQQWGPYGWVPAKRLG